MRTAVPETECHNLMEEAGRPAAEIKLHGKLTRVVTLPQPVIHCADREIIGFKVGDTCVDWLADTRSICAAGQ